MKLLDGLPLRIRALLFGLSLLSGAMFARLLAQERSASMGFMQRMNASMTEMDGAMKAAPMNGNVDHDFAAMMIPHHKGAIAMAEAELLYGKDPTMRRLAQEIVVDQKSEVDAMNLWLAKQSKAPHKEMKK
jgi:uncharacterized protein (DUF305 family)